MPRTIPVLLVLLAVLILCAGCTTSLFPFGTRADYPSIDDVGTSPGTIPVHHTFPFQDRELTISLTVENDLYTDARGSTKSVVLYGAWDSDEEWLRESYRAFVGDPRQEGMYGDLRSAFRDIRTAMGLDDDEYVELMAAFVQSITYESPEGEQTPRFPVETVVEGKGDCDDTSILLAGLLEREGYDTALFFFEEENHMAAGVRGPGAGFMGTGYEYIETTSFSLPGGATTRLQNGMRLESEPLVIAIGEGTGIYTAGDEARSIAAAAQSSREYAALIEADLEEREEEINTRHDAIVVIQERLADAGQAGNPALYTRLVSEHNRLAGDYNRLLADYDRLYADFEAYARLNNHIAGHQYDRPGLVAYISEWKDATGLPL
ncbi:MAG TPA: hypothetical protein ENN44_05205 [Methanoculleus sp.]|nr:hypothetical protein [Methanoculleus sp.]